MGSASTIPYQLRPHKAIDRNVFITILKKLDRAPDIDISKYRYIGFGAPFLEDFKILHLDMGISDMDCVEYNKYAYSRQLFNKPFSFVKLFNLSASDYITNGYFKEDKNQIIWWDFASPGEFDQQLLDTELTAGRLGDLDILKLTFNSNEAQRGSAKKILERLNDHPTLQRYLPDELTTFNILTDYSAVVRAMAIRAIRRGISNSGKELEFNHISSFKYRDGQEMTTITGIITSKNKFIQQKKNCGFAKWEFYQPESTTTEMISANEILVPAMTIKERMELDKRIVKGKNKLSKKTIFYFGENEEEHINLVNGYCRFYKYLPYYSKVTY